MRSLCLETYGRKEDFKKLELHLKVETGVQIFQK